MKSNSILNSLFTGLCIVSAAVPACAQQFRKLNANHFDLRWTTPIYNRFSETEVKSFVWFDGAQFDASKNFLPYLYISEEVYADVTLEVRLENAVYEAMDPNSVAAIGSQSNQINSEPEIIANVGKMQGRYYSDIRITPIRRGGNGSLERLVSFDLHTTRSANLRRAPM